jgi:hypothetical protein
MRSLKALMVLWMTIVVVKDIRKIEVSAPLRNGKIIKFAIVKKMGKAFNAFPFFLLAKYNQFFYCNSYKL